MATKKQKREAAEAKRAAFEEATRLSGLRAQAADRKIAEETRGKYQQAVDEVNNRHKMILADNFLAMSRAFGAEIQDLTSQGLVHVRTAKRADWLTFLHSLPEKNKRAAVDAYYEQYCKDLAGEEAKRVALTGKRIDLEARTSATLRIGPDDVNRAQKFFGALTIGGFADEAFLPMPEGKGIIDDQIG